MKAIPLLLALVASTFAVAPATALAETMVTARMVSCDGGGDCLLVRGSRASAASSVRINDRAVTPNGDRSWSVEVPVSMLRSLAAPYARTIDVAVIDPAGAVERSDAVRLPVGLLGHDVELASLVVRAR